MHLIFIGLCSNEVVFFCLFVWFVALIFLWASNLWKWKHSSLWASRIFQFGDVEVRLPNTIEEIQQEMKLKEAGNKSQSWSVGAKGTQSSWRISRCRTIQCQPGLLVGALDAEKWTRSRPLHHGRKPPRKEPKCVQCGHRWMVLPILELLCLCKDLS